MLKHHPDCYISRLLKDEWNHDKNGPIVIDRDGEVFPSIYNYIYFGALGINLQKNVSSIRALLDIQREADFYNLGDLVSLCALCISTLLSTR